MPMNTQSSQIGGQESAMARGMNTLEHEIEALSNDVETLCSRLIPVLASHPQPTSPSDVDKAVASPGNSPTAGRINTFEARLAETRSKIRALIRDLET